MRTSAVQSGYPLQPALGLQAAAKRAADLVGAALLLLLFSPLLAVIAALARLSSPAPILFRQPRVGRGGSLFILLKFRTMQPGADRLLAEAVRLTPARQVEYAAFQKLRGDPRLTRLGKILRRTSLDELPQLWNVLRGEMSLVGPRPILPEQQELYGPGLALYRLARPGLTGLWQVSGRNLLSFQDRAACDCQYLLNWTIFSDIRILLRTPWVVIRGKGAF